MMLPVLCKSAALSCLFTGGGTKAHRGLMVPSMTPAVLQAFKGQGVHLLWGHCLICCKCLSHIKKWLSNAWQGPPEGVSALGARVVASLIPVGSKQMPTLSMWGCASSGLYLACIASHAQPNTLKHSVCIQRTKYTKRQGEKGCVRRKRVNSPFHSFSGSGLHWELMSHMESTLTAFFPPYSRYSGETRPWKPANVVSGFLRYTDI